MRLYDFQAKVDDKEALTNYHDFIEFAKGYLEFIGFGKSIRPNIQAEIISTKESNYHFIQYKDDGSHCITRPINTDIFISADKFDKAARDFEYALKDIRAIKDDGNLRENINQVIYTCQQCIGCTLDAFNNPNKARKVNGRLFEILVRSVVESTGISCSSQTEHVSLQNGEKMKFEQDIIIKDDNDNIRGIGQLKTSSKDRIDKIFLDKKMYNDLKETDIPHFAIFLNDVQRSSRKDGSYSVNSTFLPGHFKAYTMVLIPLDGVYYFDLRPSVNQDDFLSDRIKKFDQFIVEDMWKLIE